MKNTNPSQHAMKQTEEDYIAWMTYLPKVVGWTFLGIIVAIGVAVMVNAHVDKIEREKTRAESDLVVASHSVVMNRVMLERFQTLEQAEDYRRSMDHLESARKAAAATGMSEEDLRSAEKRGKDNASGFEKSLTISH